MSARRQIVFLTACISMLLACTQSLPVQAAQPHAAAPQAAALPEQSASLTLAFVGDVMLARSIGDRIVRDGPTQPFAGVREILRSADLTIANLECAIADGGKAAPKAYRFLAPPASVEALSDAGIDLVSLANNHSFDWGEQAFFSTQRILHEADIASVGAGSNAEQAYAPVIMEQKGIKIAFLAYVNVPVERGGFNTARWTATATKAGVAWAEPKRIAQDVARIASQVDHVIVLLHSGYEGQQTPNKIQRENANAALQAGAHIVIGHHPHMLQGYNLQADGRLIAWSLGNFVFDGFEGTASVDTAILSLTLDKQRITGLQWTAVRIVNGFPIALNPKGEGAKILERIEKLPK